MKEELLKDFESNAKLFGDKGVLQLVQEIRRLREVVEFYADEKIYHHQSVMFDKITKTYSEYDRGQKARVALGIE